MKLGLSMWSAVHLVKDQSMDQVGFIRWAQELRVDGVELLDFFHSGADGESEQVRDALREAELPCSVFSVSNNFAKPDAGDRHQALERILSGLDRAHQYGASIIRVFGGDDHERKITLNEARPWIVEGLAQASRAARERGLRLALENHGSMAGTSAQVRGIIEEVRQQTGDDTLGANLDTGNFVLVGEDSVHATEQLEGLISMVHFKDFAPAPTGWDGFAYHSLSGDPFVGTALGEGAVDLSAVVKKLRSQGFTGWLNLEYEGAESARTAVPRSLAFGRSILGP